ncbi:FAD-dependent oxidoreductase [Candidatus Nitrospira inopinata]|uniref:Putative Pytoene desaturase n=1 Tax=Candidatus Nitrospira inopinata TaxID=1715989 RepID=A0A0S4KZ34_9BACT|nr:FAD-dependent oxidoreductase [Candidatus Nitrospira inopinata]CUQ66962.1 putative Pytoene desaturase [Candidatus Nitrospira inopinata]
MGSRLPIFVIAGASQTVLILGAGLTGSAAASLLTEESHRVTLLDFLNWEDGYKTDKNDAMPMTFGGHGETSRAIHPVEQDAALRADRTIPLEFLLPDGQTAAYFPARLPGILQWIAGLSRFEGLTRRDRWRLLTYVERIWEGTESLPADLDNRTADEWLASIGQSPESRTYIWNPLGLWLTGNGLERLAGSVFIRQLSVLFLGKARDASLTYRYGSIGDRLIGPMRHALERQGAQVLRQTEPPLLRIGPRGIEEVRLHDGGSLRAQWYIAALPYRKLLALLPEQLLARYAYFAQLAELEPLPEVMVEFRRPSTAPFPRLVLLGGELFHYLVVAPSGPNETTYRLSMIGHSPLTESTDDSLLRLGYEELRRIFPHGTPRHDQSGVVHRDDHAALSLRPGATLRRPLQQSPLPNLLLAGPWTDTGWPANVESAIASARRCTDIIRGRIAG